MHKGFGFCFLFFYPNPISYLSLVTVFCTSSFHVAQVVTCWLWFAAVETYALFLIPFSFFFFFVLYLWTIVSYRWGKHYDLNPCNSRSVDTLCVAWLDRKHTWGAVCLWGGGGRDKDLIMRGGEETGPQLPSGTGITRERIVQIRPAVSPQTHLWPPWFNCTYDLLQKKMF